MKDRKTLKFNSNVKVIDLTGKEKRTFSSYQEIHQQHTKPDEDSSKCINGCIICVYMYVCTVVKITVGGQPISGQISNVAAHFLVCLTHFRSNKSKW